MEKDGELLQLGPAENVRLSLGGRSTNKVQVSAAGARESERAKGQLSVDIIETVRSYVKRSWRSKRKGG